MDRVLENRNVGATIPVLSFGPDFVDPQTLRHQEFAPNFAADWSQEITAALRARIAAFPTPDA